ncbi:PE-PGRS protein, putative [Trichomonas vaginalis G3]|uniref:receptor protein-tyrosine kinase n=1 Tax=Trichomonas vaginalis (strain ATCC PRA-98 / G3) TaxID=412133 RepID=A2FVS8_TRIV3|nr:glycine-rich protein family [Trichomonas vaginalis G3]EAX90981.1 PE-PGRS protein, putative [Trichomonas vaginalis G3]KAI5519299.1 glycine-rich protein family [Trichomonas vaginalis G3]|eukprot:XP_001303911.1 PE-PGRS protein [Trichomonas vaginalis G3]
MISYSLVDASKGKLNVNVNAASKTYIFEYPCASTSDCTDYEITLPAGIYKFELYGASGGSYFNKVTSYRFPNRTCISAEKVKKVNGNTDCRIDGSNGGAGAYISGIISLKEKTTIFATIGGKGNYDYKIKDKDNDNCYIYPNLIEGGYGGGGSASNHYADSDWGAGSGGGQTAVKFLSNDLWHRVIVAGAGGGSDNNFTQTFGGADDGSGGAGSLEGQGWFTDGVYNSNYLANSTFGFSFGYGETAQKDRSQNPNGVQSCGGYSDRAGAGGGWFGGFASHHGNGGAGGGSSWVLTSNAIIPEGKITAYDSSYNLSESRQYAFSKHDYDFHHIVAESGVWEGYGRLIIKSLGTKKCACNNNIRNYFARRR